MVVPVKNPTPTPTPSGEGTYSPTQYNLALGLKTTEDPVNKTKIAKGKAQADTAAKARAAAAGKPGPIINPPLSSLSTGTFMEGRNLVSLQKGYIKRIAENAAGLNGVTLPANQQYIFRFLYNPTTIDFSNGVFMGVVPPEYTNPNDYPSAHFPGQETVSFSLMLDRTQEVYEQGLAARGTQVDVDQLYRVINGNQVNPGYLSLSAVEINWGPTTQNGHPIPPFPCYITNVSVSHTQFTPRMAPMRSIVSITANALIGVGNALTINQRNINHQNFGQVQ